MKGGGPGLRSMGNLKEEGLTSAWAGMQQFFRPEIYVILACVYELKLQNRSEKYVSICSDSQADLKALKAIRTTSPLVQQCQMALNYICTWYAVGLYWVPGHAGIRGKEMPDELARGGSGLGFLGPEPVLGVTRRDIQNKLNCWLVNQQWARWRSIPDTQRQVRELISGPSVGAKIKVMFFNRTQSRAVIGLLAGHNTLRRHLYLLGLQVRPVCRKCGVMEEISAHILCECVALASLRHAYLGFFFLEPKDIQSISLGGIWSFSNTSRLP
jgi:hypothetical protein